MGGRPEASRFIKDGAERIIILEEEEDSDGNVRLVVVVRRDG